MKEEYTRGLKKWLVPIAFLICAVGVVVITFYVKVNMERESSTKSNMLFVTKTYAKGVYQDMEILKNAAEMTSEIFSEEEILTQNADGDILRMLKEHTPAYEVIYYKGDGVGMASDGTERTLSGCSYFEQIQSAEQVEYIFAQDTFSGQEALIVAVPIENHTSQSILLYYGADKIKANMNVSGEFKTNAFSALVNFAGDYLLKAYGETKFFEADNLWDSIKNEKNQTAVAGAVSTAKNGYSGVVQGEFLEEARTIVYYPMGISDWVFVIGINQKYVDRQEHGQWEDARRMLLELLAVAVIFLVSIGVIDILSKKHEEDKNKKLFAKADIDLLTGLNNKIATENKIKEYIHENPNEMGMMFIVDLDDFKKINDTKGHAFGDEVLRSFGEKIGTVFRASDIIGRAGGDEFILFLKHLKNDENTLAEAKKLEMFFKEFVVGNYVKYSVSASIGAAVFPQNGADFESLYKAADKALYKAKKRGKNQLAFYDDRDRETQE